MSQSDRLEAAIDSQALLLPETGMVVALRATPGAGLDAIGRARLVCAQSFRPIHDALADQGFAVALEPEEPATVVLVTLTRARAENLGNIAKGLDLLEPGGMLVVNGAKTEGVDSLAKQVAAELPLEGQTTKAHGRVFWLRRPETLPPAVLDWAAGNAPRRNGEGYVTAPGMFSPETVDAGSRRLALAMAGRLKGRVADLGAGWGWLAGQALEQASITQMDLYEAEGRALDAARINVTDPRAGFYWSDVTALGKGTLPYDWVIVNPPFHQGRAAEPELGTGFISAASRILKPSGQMLLVANRQLPYEATLEARFRNWEKLSEDGIYKVILAQRPRRA